MPVVPPPDPWLSENSVWQLIESGSYRIDLPAWARICEGNRTVLDLGCGYGRVAHFLSRSGCRIIGIERDPGTGSDFRRLAVSPDTRVVIGDVLELDRTDLDPRQFDRILAPQQLIQILGGNRGRHTLISQVRRRLSPSGVAAFAFCPDLPQDSFELDLSPDRFRSGGWTYESRPVSIESREERVEVTRIRSRTSPAGRSVTSSMVTRFDRLPADRFRSELEAGGLVVDRMIPLAATGEHVASTIAIARSPDPAT
ncbi:MAG: class I SAM-dependent methyltransferase [Solirubrobacterales bacterium]|nr:class I SAM-dependent methyltransferase [Solirubrobacterales bacterium]